MHYPLYFYVSMRSFSFFLIDTLLFIFPVLCDYPPLFICIVVSELADVHSHITNMQGVYHFARSAMKG